MPQSRQIHLAFIAQNILKILVKVSFSFKHKINQILLIPDDKKLEICDLDWN